MRFYTKLNLVFLVLAMMLVVWVGGCVAPARSTQSQATAKAAQTLQNKAAQKKTNFKRLRRKYVSSRNNQYEGSLWRYESSFGNLLRDHRARFRGDLLNINELALVVNVPPPQAADGGAPAGGAETANVVLEAMTFRDSIEEEQNEILRSLDTMSARVIRVLPDGNMLVQGQKVDYRQRNKVRYITTITGILRPADVNDSNIVSASKLANPNVKIKRQQSGSLVRERLDKLAPLLGKQKAGLTGRLSDFATGTAAQK